MEDSIVYGPVSPYEAEALLEFYTALQLEQPYLHIYPDDALHSLQELEQYVRRMNRSDGSHIAAAKLGRRVIGCVTIEELTLEGRRGVGELGISVLKQHRDRGIGSRLMHEVLVWAREVSRLKEVVLHVDGKNRRALHIYTGLGFQIEDCNEVGYVQGRVQGGGVCMRLAVASQSIEN